MAKRLISQRPFHEDTVINKSDTEPNVLPNSEEERNNNDTISEKNDTDIEIAVRGVAENERVQIQSTAVQNKSREREENENSNLPFEGGFCIHCTTYKLIKTIDDIKRGDSIRFQRLQGVYFHHAIVEEAVQVHNKDEACLSLTLIHLQKHSPVFMTGLATTTEEFDLNKKIIEKVIYKSIRFQPDEIVNRAKVYAEQNPSPRRYTLITCNCETLATEFAQDVKCSGQVITKCDQIKSFFFSIFNVSLKIVSRVVRLPGIGPIASVFALVNIIRQMKELKNWLKDKIICLPCFHKHRNKLKIAFTFGLISFAVSVISHMNWPTLIISLIISIVLPIVVPLVHKHIMPLVQPAFNVPKHEISTKKTPKIGDVVTFYYIGIPHEGIVSRVHRLDSDETGFKATIVHFPWPGIFQPYTVTKETLYFKEENEVHILNFEGVDHLSSELVVKNALQKVGKQNHSHFTYRSSHMARLCKTGKKSLRKLPMLKVQSYEDLSPGDVIRFKYCGLPHAAVVIQTAMAEHVKADVIHYNFNGMFGTRKVVEETFTFNLKDKNTYIHDYTGVEVYEPEEVVRRAQSRLGEQKFNTFTNRSSHLAKWCKVKSIPS